MKMPALLYFSVLSFAAVAQTPDTKGVETIDRQFDQSFVTRDLDALFKNVASDCVFYGTDPADHWTVSTFRKMVDNNNKNKRPTPVTTSRSISFMGSGDVAIVTKQVSWPLFKTPLREVAVYEKKNGWKLHYFSLNILYPDQRLEELNLVLSKK